MTNRRTITQQLRIQTLALESAVEIAIAVGHEGARAFTSVDPRNPGAPSDVVREAILEAATELAELEVAREELWDRHDWRDTCDAIANVINRGDVAYVEQLLR